MSRQDTSNRNRNRNLQSDSESESESESASECECEARRLRWELLSQPQSNRRTAPEVEPQWSVQNDFLD